jgi:hypothetical protein
MLSGRLDNGIRVVGQAPLYIEDTLVCILDVRVLLESVLS